MTKVSRSVDLFGRNIVLVFLGTSLVNFLNLLYQLLIAHQLTPQDFAAFNSLLSLFLILSSPLMTLQTAVGKYGAQFRVSQEDNKVVALLLGLLKRALGFALATFLVFYALSSPILEKLKIDSPGCGLMLSVLLASAWFTPILLGGIQGMELFGWYTLVLVFAAGLKLVLSFLFIRLKFNMSGALLALVLASVSGILFALFSLRGLILRKGKKEDVPLSEIFVYTLPVAVSFFCFMSLVNMDLVLVKVFFSPAESGVYSLAQMIGKAFLYLPAAISIVILPRASSLNAQNLDTRPILKKSLLIALLLCALAILIYNLFPYAVLRILTGKTLPQSVFIGRLFSLSMTFYTLLYILITYFLSIKDLRFIKILGTLTVFQLLGLVFFHQTLIQVQGVLCVSSFVLCASHFYLLRKTPELSSQRAR